MTKKIQCSDCGEPMLEMYTRKGLRIYLCPHTITKSVDTRMGLPAYGIIYCRREIFGLKRAFENMTDRSNLTIVKLRDATENKIDDASLLKSANLALELEFEPNLLPDLFNAAMYLGYSLGLGAQKSIESLVTGIARKSRLMLDNIGVIFLAEQAYRWYLNKHADANLHELTEEDRDKAWKDYAIHQVIQKAKNIRRVGQLVDRVNNGEVFGK